MIYRSNTPHISKKAHSTDGHGSTAAAMKTPITRASGGLKDKVTAPDVLIEAHSAPLQIDFYDGDSFPLNLRVMPSSRCTDHGIKDSVAKTRWFAFALRTASPLVNMRTF